MEYGNGRATMIWFMFRTLETFLVKAAENLSNKIFCLGLVRQEKPSGPLESRQARPGPHLKAAAKAGLAA
jgi:hypothetical protein